MPACDQRWNELLSAYHDGEANGSERALVEAHVLICSDCARARQEFWAIGDRLRSMAERPVSGARAVPRSVRRALAIAAALLTVSGVAVAGARTLRRSGLDSAFATELEQHHLRSFSRAPSCEFESSDPAAVSDWVQRTMGYRIEIPAIAGATLLGARRCPLDGQSAAHLLYRVGERALTVYVPASGSDAHGAAARFAQHGPRCEKGPFGDELCIVATGDQVQVAVSEIPAPTLLSLVSTRASQ